jgi:hypothetical protein
VAQAVAAVRSLQADAMAHVDVTEEERNVLDRLVHVTAGSAGDEGELDADEEDTLAGLVSRVRAAKRERRLQAIDVMHGAVLRTAGLDAVHVSDARRLGLRAARYFAGGHVLLREAALAFTPALDHLRGTGSGSTCGWCLGDCSEKGCPEEVSGRSCRKALPVFSPEVSQHLGCLWDASVTAGSLQPLLAARLALMLLGMSEKPLGALEAAPGADVSDEQVHATLQRQAPPNTPVCEAVESDGAKVFRSALWCLEGLPPDSWPAETLPFFSREARMVKESLSKALSAAGKPQGGGGWTELDHLALTGIAKTNAVELRLPLSHSRVGLPDAVEPSPPQKQRQAVSLSRALFPATVSLLNHSCAPNCALSFEAGPVAKLVTLRDVLPGEELTVSYIDVESLNGAERFRQLQLHHAFNCDCQGDCVGRQGPGAFGGGVPEGTTVE